MKNFDITTVKTSPEPQLPWKKLFHKNPLEFRIYVDCEADNEKDDFRIGIKTTNIYKRNPILSGYHVVSELEDILKSDYYKPHLRYDEVDCFVKEVIKLGKKLTFYFKIFEKDIVMTGEDEEDYRKNSICRFCGKILNLIKLEVFVT